MRPPVEKNDIIELTIHGLGSEGQGVGRVDGYAVFLPGALPGELARAQVIKVTSGYCVARLLEVLSPSRDRVDGGCPAYPRCGGCTLRHLSYAGQLAAKTRQVKEALERLGGFEAPPVLPAIGMESPCRYRNKGSFPFGPDGEGRAEIGFFARRSHRLVPLEDCPIQDERIVTVARIVRDWARKYGVQPYDEAGRKGLLRHVMARASAHGVLGLVVSAGPLPHKAELVDALRAGVDGLTGIVHNLNRADTNVILGPEYTTLWGEDRLRVDMCGAELWVSMPSFLQVNPIQAEALYGAAIDMLGLTGRERVADVYCGIGSISLLLARRAGDVIGIEVVEEAVSDARLNTERNGIANARFIAGEAEAVLPALLRDGLKLDAAVIDPPRKGCDEAALHALAASGADRIAYVSCNPATLARDCRILSGLGYRLVKAQPVDMFPHTNHIECAALLTKS